MRHSVLLSFERQWPVGGEHGVSDKDLKRIAPRIKSLTRTNLPSSHVRPLDDPTAVP